MKQILVILLLIVPAAGGVAYYVLQSSADPPPNFRMATVKRSDLTSVITATGTVEPEDVVDVGSQVVGKLESLGRDPSDPAKAIDYGSVVHKGTVLAKIDALIYAANVDQATANLARAQADLLQYQAKRLQAEKEWKRAEQLLPQKAIAATDYDLAVANYKAAAANVGVGEAVIKQTEAALRLAKTNFDYTTITSPVEGVIIDRRVNVGQTVVASLNAPSLFLIAKDLKRMQVWASVNEADIGRIRRGMAVRFTVDAHPKTTFLGAVEQIRLNAQQTQNVVTYTVVVSTDNTDGKLLPYLTANLQFEVEKRPGVLQVPNGALRWKPRLEQVVLAARESYAAALEAAKNERQKGRSDGDAAKDQAPKRDRADRKNAKGAAASDAKAKPPEEKAEKPAVAAENGKPRDDRGRVWLKEGNFVRPVEVQIGATDGTNTEISGGEIQEDMEVVVGEKSGEQVAGDTTNPFAPKIFRGKR